MASLSDKLGLIGQRLLNATHRLFHYFHRIQDGYITEQGFRKQISILQVAVELALTDGRGCSDKAMSGACRELRNRFQNLFVFLYHQEVKLTHNSAKRLLRHVVIWKQRSFL